MDHVDVAVIGGGPAGLAASRELTRTGLEHLVLERARVGESWRGRWDSFRLVTPNWSTQLPGRGYDGIGSGRLHGARRGRCVPGALRGRSRSARPRGCRGRLPGVSPGRGLRPSNVVGRSSRRRCGRRHRHLPVSAPAGLRPRRCRPICFNWMSATTATSGLSRRAACSWWEAASPGARSRRSSTMRAGKCSWPAGRLPGCPRRLGGRDSRLVGGRNGLPRHVRRVLAHSGSPARRECAGDRTRRRGRDLNLRTLRERGVTLTGHFLGAGNGRARFASDLAESVAWGDERYEQFASLVRKLIAERGLDLPELDRPKRVRPDSAREPRPCRLRSRPLRRRLPPGLRLLAALAGSARRPRVSAPARRREHGDSRLVLRRRPLHAQSASRRPSWEWVRTRPSWRASSRRAAAPPHELSRRAHGPSGS